MHILLTCIAMIAFAGNSLICRAALELTSIDPASFTSIRILSGALTLLIILKLRSINRQTSNQQAGSWAGAIALFIYAVAFSFAYLELSTGTGALLLFGCVQLTMLGYGFLHGERLSLIQSAGLLAAIVGVFALLAPGATAPALKPSLLMIASGVAWGVYSIIGRSALDPIAESTGNFTRAVFPSLLVSLVFLSSLQADISGVLLAIASGSITSALGYVVWYAVLPQLKSITAASVQLSVPIIAAIAGLIVLGEPLSLRLILCTIAVLGGIAMVIYTRPDKASIDEA